jgi:hypothetical protein
MARGIVVFGLSLCLAVGILALAAPAVSQDIGWRGYTDMRVDTLASATEQRFKSMETAIAVAQESLNTRMEASNEKFALLKEQAAEFATKEEVDRLRTQVTELRLGSAVTGPFVSGFSSMLVTLVIGAALAWFAFYLRAKKPPAGGGS